MRLICTGPILSIVSILRFHSLVGFSLNSGHGLFSAITSPNVVFLVSRGSYGSQEQYLSKNIHVKRWEVEEMGFP